MARPIDLMPGDKFNKWTVDGFAYKKGYDKYYYCTCECGEKKIVLGNNLRRGLSKSCGCERHKQPVNYRDRTGERYNSLVCIRPEKRGGYIYWLCKCDCGNETIVRGENLTSGAVKSCGCAGDHSNRIHGMSHTRLHNIWSRLFYRCYNPKCVHFKHYGGRGIRVCDEWHGTGGFQRFMKWALSNGYEETLTLDRINVNGNYEPDNCRWITQKQQMNNTRVNRFVSYNGQTHTVAEWSEITGISYATLSQRINKLNWPIEKALTKEVKTCGVK